MKTTSFHSRYPNRCSTASELLTAFVMAAKLFTESPLQEISRLTFPVLQLTIKQKFILISIIVSNQA